MNANAYSATHDALTRLPNEFLFQDRLIQTVAMSERGTNLFALVLLVADNLGRIHQLQGASFCDPLIVRIAERLQQAFREPDTICRRQDNSFLILMPQIDGQQALVKLIHRLRKTLAEPFYIDTHSVHLSFSLGKAIYPYDGTTAASLMQQVEADVETSQPGV